MGLNVSAMDTVINLELKAEVRYRRERLPHRGQDLLPALFVRIRQERRAPRARERRSRRSGATSRDGPDEPPDDPDDLDRARRGVSV